MPPPHLSLCISEVRLGFCPRFSHVRALIPLLSILRKYYHLIDDSVYLRHYFPVINCPYRVRSELLDLKGTLHKVCKGSAGVPFLIETRLVFWYHKQVDWALRGNMCQEIPHLRVMKAAMEVPHPKYLSGGECLIDLLLDILINVNPLLPLSEVFDVRPDQITWLHCCWPDCNDCRRAGIGGYYIRRVYRNEGILGVLTDVTRVPILPAAFLRD